MVLALGRDDENSTGIQNSTYTPDHLWYVVITQRNTGTPVCCAPTSNVLRNTTLLQVYDAVLLLSA